MNRYITTLDAARALGVSPDTVRRWARLGRLPVAETTASGIRLYERSVVTELAQVPPVGAPGTTA